MENTIEKRLDVIESRLDKILGIVELLDTIIKVNINKEDPLEVKSPKLKHNERDLVYTVKEDFIYIYGTKTYEYRDIIKSSFIGANWSKEKFAWAFKIFDNYEDSITTIFPDIVKDQ
jgi:hypothetical protein